MVKLYFSIVLYFIITIQEFINLSKHLQGVHI
jgi:hypothetical protein